MYLESKETNPEPSDDVRELEWVGQLESGRVFRANSSCSYPHLIADSSHHSGSWRHVCLCFIHCNNLVGVLFGGILRILPQPCSLSLPSSAKLTGDSLVPTVQVWATRLWAILSYPHDKDNSLTLAHWTPPLGGSWLHLIH